MSNKPSLSEKLIATLSKAKNSDEMIKAFNELQTFYENEIEKYRKELMEKAAKLPKINNGNNPNE